MLDEIQDDMIEFKQGAYILGIWYAERKMFGKVYVYALQGKEEGEWDGYIKYLYHNENINIYMDNENPFNKFINHGISEEEMIKVCKDKIEELHCIFCHEIDYVLIKGDFHMLEKLKEKKRWLPPMREEPLYGRRKRSKFAK